MNTKYDINTIEKIILKKYRKLLYSPMVKAIKEYNMIKPKDKIAVCISGGKDSLLLAKSLELFNRYTDDSFSLEFIAMDPGFTKENRMILENACQYLHIPVKIFETDVFAVANKMNSESPCYLCARRRRGALYEFAQSLGCNKIALGHHYDDIIETTMLNILYAGNFGTMLPRLKADNYENMELIRPLTYVREKDIINYTKYIELQPMNCGCAIASKKVNSKRAEVKELLAQLRKQNPLIDKSIFASGKNVYLDTVQGFRFQNKKYNFLEFLDEE